MFPVNQNNSIEGDETIEIDLVDIDIEIPFNYLKYILNSKLVITPEILFDGFKKVLPFYQDDQLKPLFELAFDQDVNINSQNKDNGCTFLHYSVEDVKVLYDNIPQFLLEKGADPNIQNKDGNTPLHILINRDFFSSKEIYVAKLLIQYGADIELKNLLGWTPIQLAVQASDIEIVKLLIQYGADIDAVISESCNAGQSLIELVPRDNLELKTLLKLTKSCKDNNFSELGDITFENIKEFIDWQISITPENSKFFLKHLKELSNFQKHLSANPKLIDVESIQNLNKTINSYSTLKNSLIFKIVENHSSYDKSFMLENLSNDLITKFEELRLKLTGEVIEDNC